MPPLPFDFLVIGGGSGGLGAARRASSYGAKVALFEGGRLGGTCVNVGCVPKKVMWNAAHMADLIRHDARDYTFDLTEWDAFDFRTFKVKRDDYVKRLNGIYARNLIKDSVEHIPEYASFVDENTVVAGDLEYTAPHILIATGGEPMVQDIPGKEWLATSDDFFNKLDFLPKRTAVIGAGYIAVELSQMLQSLGSDVSIFTRHEYPLRNFDDLIYTGVKSSMEEQGVNVVSNSAIKEVVKDKGGMVTLIDNVGDEYQRYDCSLTLIDADGNKHQNYDYAVTAIGRGPLSSKLNLEKIGVKVNKRGHIESDEWEQTNVQGIYSLGDVSGKIELTPVAIAAGRALADRLFGGFKESKMDYVNVPSVIFTHPPCASIGISEKQAREQFKDDDIKVYTSKFTNMHYAVTEHKPKTQMKVICVGKEEKVAGIHMTGLGVDEMMQGFGVAVKMGATKADLDSCCAIHPTASEELVTMR